MNAAERDQVEALLRVNWDHEHPSDAGMAKRLDDVDDFPVDQVLAAVEAVYRDGAQWMPKGRDIRNKLIELSIDLPDWATVLDELRKISNRGAFHPAGQGGPSAEEREAMIARADPAVLPVIRGFAAHIGWPQVTAGLHGDGNDEARLRDKYTAFVRRGKRELAYRGLDPAGLPVLERIAGQSDGPRRIGDVVKELTP